MMNQRTLKVGGKYHCTACLQFDWFGFNSFVSVHANNKKSCLVKSNPAKLVISHTVILPPCGECCTEEHTEKGKIERKIPK